MPARFKYHFSVLGRYEARLRGNESAVTVNLATGHDRHLTHAGTLTMTEAEWERLVEALRESLGDDLEIDDKTGG